MKNSNVIKLPNIGYEPSKEEKPYDRCITCEKLGTRCDGPNFLAMTIERWCEWCRLRKEYLHITNAYIAEAADVSKVTVDRIIAGSTTDIRTSTMQAVTRVLVNGTWGQYPCADPNPEQEKADPNPALETRCEEQATEITRLRGIIDQLNAEHRADLRHAEEERKIEVEHLYKEIETIRASYQRGLDDRAGVRRALIGVIIALVALILFFAVDYTIFPDAGLLRH